jgi:Undecaprenyl-phosphate galactose phosphotransferase WbaP
MDVKVLSNSISLEAQFASEKELVGTDVSIDDSLDGLQIAGSAAPRAIRRLRPKMRQLSLDGGFPERDSRGVAVHSHADAKQFRGRSTALAPSPLNMPRNLVTMLPLLAADVASVSLATVFALAALRLMGPIQIGGIHWVTLPITCALVIGYACCGLYAVVGVHPVVELRQLVRLNTLVLLASVAATLIVSARSTWWIFFTLMWVASIVLLPVFRSIARGWGSKQAWWGQPALIFGGLEEASRMADVLRRDPACGLTPMALVCEDAPFNVHWSHGLRVLDKRAAKRLVRCAQTSYGIVVSRNSGDARDIKTASDLRLSHVLLMSPDSALPSLWPDARQCAGMHALQIGNRLLMPWPRLIKRVSDLSMTLIGGTLILPVFLVIAVMIKLSTRGPIFFGHTRLGQRGEKFKAWKFRTMRPDADAILAKHLESDPLARTEWEQDHKLRDDPRVTPIGRILRKTSLDELPQLWNVLRGEMSLVGPRPIVDEEIPKYGPSYAQYVRVRPGVTGLWQVSGRNDTTYAQRVQLDDYYVSNWSPWLDLHVLARTFRALLARQGAY